MPVRPQGRHRLEVNSESWTGQPLHVLEFLHDHQIEFLLFHFGQQPLLPAAARGNVDFVRVDHEHPRLTVLNRLQFPTATVSSRTKRSAHRLLETHPRQ